MTDQVLPASEAVPATATGNDAAPRTLTAPGFRFHPTDEELISYYLKRKVQGKPMRLDVIGEVDVYKHEPSDLPELSKLKTKDQEWFFFSTLEKKYSHDASINRATKEGYWKKTGEDKEIRRDGKSIGIVKSLLFYRGRAPKRQPTNWVIHEYRLVDDGQGLEMDAYVLCRVFRKQHFGPSSKVIYAPFSEQDWDDDGGINKNIQQENHSQSMNLIDLNELKDLQKEKQQMAVERETHNLDMMNAEAMISLPRGKIDELRAENEELKEEQQ